MNRLLHSVNIPEATLNGPRSEQQSRLAKRGILSESSGATEDIASEPGEQTLKGVVGGKFARLTALELEELFQSDLTVPYGLRDGTRDSQIDGYYQTENIDVSRGTAQSPNLQKFDGQLVRAGTRRSHWRAVRTNPQTVDNPFGSASTPEVGLTIRASKVRWFDAVGGTIEDATVQRTVAGEHDDLHIYDASEPSFDDPVLIYDIPYEQEYPTDCTVWDTYNRPKVYREPETAPQVGSATVGSATVGSEQRVPSQWQRVFITDHQWVGDVVLETDRLRLAVREPEDDLQAYRWNSSEGQYNIVQLGVSDWRLFDINVTDIGLARVEAQFEFENQSDGSRHTLDATLIRGLEDVVWTVPTNESSPPQGLIDRLDPIADDSDRVLLPTVDLVERSEVDR